MSLLTNNPELRACFESDAFRLITELQETLAALAQPTPDHAHIVTVQELVHTLRGAASLIEAEPLSDACGDFMRLADVADSYKNSAWDKAAEIFTFMQERLDTLLNAVMFVLEGSDEKSATLCGTIRDAARAEWADYFYDGNVTQAEGGFDAANKADNDVTDFLTEVGNGSEASAQPAAETVAETPAQAADLADDFLSSVEETPAATTESPAAPACPVEDFLGAVSEDSSTPAATNEATDDFLSAMESETPTAAQPNEAAAVEDFLGALGGSSESSSSSSSSSSSIAEPDLLPYFYEDALTNLDSLKTTLAEWEQNPENTDALHALHRFTHTIKGAARTTGLPAIGDMVNSVEDVLEDAIEKTVPFTTASVAVLVRKMSDAVHASITELKETSALNNSIETFAVVSEYAAALRNGEVPAGLDSQSTATVFADNGSSSSSFSSSSSTFEADLLPYFYEDALNNIESLEASLQQWEANTEDAASLQAVYRHTHTIKGAANSTGLADIGRMVHAVEDALEDVVEKRLSIAPAALATLVYEMVDGIKSGIRELKAAGAFSECLKSFGSIAEKAAALRSGESKPQTKRRKGKKQTAVVATESAVAAAPAEVVAESTPACAPCVPCDSLVPSEPAPAAAAAPTPDAAPDTQTIRISSQRLDTVMNLIGELIINRSRLDKKILDMARLKEELNFCKSRLVEAIGGFHERFEYSKRNRSASRRGSNDIAALGLNAPASNSTDGFSDIEFDRYDEFNILARSLVEIGNDTNEIVSQLDKFFGSFGEESGQFNKTTTNLQNEVTRIRMVPLTQLFRRLQRSVRDAAQRESKDVEFALSGGETQLDKNIVDEIYSPLLHLVRNSVSHGIESGDRRQKSGKSARGTVSVRAFQESNQVVIEVSDDGGGLNFTAIRNTAIERGLISPDAQLTEEELTNLIFRAGFSTAKTVSQISGRGVGMDVVSAVVSRLNGTIEVRSVAGKGSTFTVRLPLTLAINQAMMISVSGNKFALPLSFVEHIVPFRAEGVLRSGDAELWRTENASIPLVRLDRVLELPASEDRFANVVLVRVANKSLALVVDEQLTRQDIVVKPLGSLLSSQTVFSGATLSGDGDVILIFDLPAIEAAYRNSVGGSRAAGNSGASRKAKRAERRGRVLVVDDSLSVRKVAEKYLAAIGYESVLAVDGLDALEKLRTNDDIAAVLTDLEMPRMHGYELVAEIRSNAATRELPVIVVTSRDAEKHRKRAAELGASDYITKPFTREQLAERLERLLAGASQVAVA